MRNLLITAAFFGAWFLAENANNILPGWLVSAMSIAFILAIPVGLFLIIRKVAR